MNLKSYMLTKDIRQSSLARAIGVQVQLVYYWANGIRPIPIHHCVSIERVTGGMVTRKDLRPSDWWKIWPELVDGAGSRPSRPSCGGGGSDADGGSGDDGVVCGGVSEEG